MRDNLATESGGLIRHLMLTSLLVFAAGACGPDEPTVMDRGAFIDVMIQLRQAELDADTAGFGARRDEILASAGVTDSMLVEFARVRGRDAAFMAEVWDSIDKVVNEVRDPEEDLVPDTTGPS
jgi:hypothetical protein